MNVLVAVTALLAVLVPCLYIYAASAMPSQLPSLRNKRICLLIAHPDDEAMFFAPTVLALTRPETGNHVKILCLSTGDADGLGETRKKELIKSGKLLGLRDEDDVFVINNQQDFPDSMTQAWDATKIANLLCSAFAPYIDRSTPTSSSKKPPSSPRSPGGGPPVNIDVLITFDDGGVSSHTNHISLYHGARAFVKVLLQAQATSRSPVALYTLTSVNVLRKYTSMVDAVTTLANHYMSGPASTSEQPEALVFLNHVTGGEPSLGTAWKAMTEAHVSQMAWFRYLWIVFSRYMLINDLKLEDV